MSILWSILMGAVAGFLASLLMKGKGSGFLINLIIGIVGGMSSSCHFMERNNRKPHHFSYWCCCTDLVGFSYLKEKVNQKMNK